MVRDGIPFTLVPLLLAVLLFLSGWFWQFPVFYVAAFFSLFTAAFMAYFFRDPERAIPFEPGLIVSPADGKITRVEKLDPQKADSATLVSIFLSPLDVHINRAPLEGVVIRADYIKGQFLMATREDSSLLNEQNALTIQGENITIVCKQIAGILARRIVCWKKAGDLLKRGERFGLIKFSSRTDLILPPQVEVKVAVGNRVKGGSTVIGKIIT